MKRFFAALAALLAGTLPAFPDVPLVENGKPVAEIVLAEDATPSVKAAAGELQRWVEAMSGARLPIVAKATPEVGSQVYVGESEGTRKLGFSLDDVKRDGFKIVAGDRHVIVAGREFYNFAKHFSWLRDVPKGERQKAWEQLTGRKWRLPPMLDPRDFSPELGFHSWDGTGTLYAVYNLLEQLGMRWYAPVPELGVVVPERKSIGVKEQSIKKEPEFAARYFADCRVGASIQDEFLWQKSMGIGGDRFVPLYHSLSGPLKMYPEEQPPEYYGKVGGKTDFHVPRLSNERLRADTVKYLELVDEHFPGIGYMCIGQPDGWIFLDDEDAAAGWDKFQERGPTGRFSDYAWDFNLDVRKRLKEKFPDKKFTVFAYSNTSRPPANLEKVPEDMVVGFTQTSAFWMLPESKQAQANRDEWLSKMKGKDQLFIWEYYLQHASRYNLPPVPLVFPDLMKKSFDGLYDRSLGFVAEIGWSDIQNPRAENKPVMARPWLSHLMLYLHNKLCWDRNLDPRAVLEEYYDLFYGPAKAEMKEFFEFAESVWTRPEPRQVTASGGFLKRDDVGRFFAILERAKAKAGDTVYGRRIAAIEEEMEPLKGLFEKLERTGPALKIRAAASAPRIDGDLDEPFWRAGDPDGGSFLALRDMRTGEPRKEPETKVSFRWLEDDSALVVGIECFEPHMDRLRESCKDPDSMAIFADDMVEIRLETAKGIRPLIGINSAGVVFDQCVTERLEDLPSFYKVEKVAVKKYPDRWTVEALIDAKTISGDRPTASRPWGVHVNRQRMAGDAPEHSMLSPSGTNFKDTRSMAEIKGVEP